MVEWDLFAVPNKSLGPEMGEESFAVLFLNVECVRFGDRHVDKECECGHSANDSIGLPHYGLQCVLLVDDTAGGTDEPVGVAKSVEMRLTPLKTQRTALSLPQSRCWRGWGECHGSG